MDVGSTTQLTATVRNGRGESMSTAATWASSTPGVGTVDNSGTVTGVAEGSTNMTASAGGKSGSATVTVNDPFPPAQPTNVLAAPVSNIEVQVTWTDNASNEDEFRIEREGAAGGVSGTDGGPSMVFTQVGSVGPNVTTFQDTGLEPGTAYSYRVRACNENGCSDPVADPNDVTTYTTLLITTAALPQGATGSLYSTTLGATGGDGTFLWSLSAGILPGGLSLASATGIISGTPLAAGSFPLTVQVQGGGQQVVTADLTLDVSFVFACSTQSEIPQTECEALEILYNTTNGPSWTTSTNWLEDFSPCGWHGVTCEEGSVTRLGLNSNALTGPIPPELGDLSELRTLVLSNNELTGTIPSGLQNLSNLSQLRLTSNQLTGFVPSFLGSMVSLTDLNLLSNELTGSIPPELGNLANLEYLGLGGNLLSGTIPAEIWSLFSLESLQLTSNQLAGTVPIEVGNLVNLDNLGLGKNQFTGPIPPVLGNLTELIVLSLGGNQLTGAIPSELGNLVNLLGLYLWGNQLSGSIPSELGNLAKLSDLSLDDNQLTGEIPPELGNLSNLRSFKLQSNELTSTVPLAVAQLGGSIQSVEGAGQCRFLPGNTGLTLLDTQAYRDADLDGDGFICKVGFPTAPVGGENLIYREVTGLSRFSEGRRRWGIGYVSWGGASFQH